MLQARGAASGPDWPNCIAQHEFFMNSVLQARSAEVSPPELTSSSPFGPRSSQEVSLTQSSACAPLSEWPAMPQAQAW